MVSINTQLIVVSSKCNRLDTSYIEKLILELIINPHIAKTGLCILLKLVRLISNEQLSASLTLNIVTKIN